MRLRRFISLARVALAAGVPLSLLAGAASAHQVWLEPSGSATRLYFGEFGDNLHEVSPGYLDKLTQVDASVVSTGGAKNVPAKKERDHIAISGQAKKGESVVAQDVAYPLLESKEGTKTTRTAWTPAARFVPQLGPQSPTLALDVVPTNDRGEFQVVYRGTPLAKAEVSLVAQSGWSLSGRTDEAGKVRFELPWRGTYALLVRHKDMKPGKRKNAQGVEESFDGESFGTTLTFTTSSGLPSPPPPPAAPPNAL